MAKDRKQNDLQPEKLGWAILTIEAGIEGYRGWQVEVTGFSVRAPLVQHGEYLMVIKGTDEAGGPIVAFHSSTSLADLFTGCANRLVNGSLKWRDDEFRR